MQPTHNGSGERMPRYLAPSSLANFAIISTFALLLIVPSAEASWKEKTQIIWNKETGTLIRKNFKVWDPHPELDLDFLWEPDLKSSSNNSDDIVNGVGTLTWHDKGAANYDRRFTYSVFKGTLRNGRPEGQGVLSVRTGLNYTGPWVKGEMHGRGVLRLENGDKYEGDFIAGKMHGVGRYASAEGAIYFGEFRNGVRHGIGRLLLIDGAYRTVWHAGAEVARQRIPNSTPSLPIAGLQLAAASSAVKIKLTMDQQKAREREILDPDAKGPAFEANYGPGLVTIRLASKKRLAAWKKDAPIASGQQAGPDYIMSSWSFPPVFLKAELQNQSSKAIEVAGAFLDVHESTLDPTPYLELHRGGELYETDGSYNPLLDFENLGWGDVRNARMTYWFATAKKRTAEAVVDLGSFESSKRLSIEDQLQKLGVDVEKLKKASSEYRRNAELDAEELNKSAFHCDDNVLSGNAALAACFEREKKSGVFGSLRDFVFRQRNDNIVYVALAGRIEYQWLDGSGKSSARVSTFSIFVPLVHYNIVMAEMGGEVVTPYPDNSVELSLERRRYRVSLPKEDWTGKVGQNQLKQFQFSVSSQKSSHHLFQFILLLTDGTEVTSPAVDLLYFRPRVTKKHEELINPPAQPPEEDEASRPQR